MSLTKVALVGATGNIGPSILSALLSSNFHVTILTREGSTSTDSLPSHPNQTIRKVNFTSVSDLTTALSGIDAVVSNVASSALLSQKPVIDAAVAAGVQRFLPSDFGSDMSHPMDSSVPFNAPKVEIHKYILQKVKENPKFTYTFVYTGPFFDWSLAFGIFGDLKSHTATLWDGGDTRVSTTTLASVGRAVVGVLQNAEATRNKEIRVADTTISQKQIIDIAKSIDGVEWTTTPGDTAVAYQAGLEEFSKPEPNIMVGVLNQLYRIMFCKEFGTNFGDNLDNEMVGLGRLSEEEVKEVVKRAMGA